MQAGQSESLPEPGHPVLPPEIWTEIFKHLTPGQLLKMRQVCRGWRDIATGRSVLRAKLAVTFMKTFPNEVGSLLPVGKINFDQLLLAEVCSWWPSLGPGLVQFRLSYCSIELPVLIGFLKHTPNLKVLQLDGMDCSGEFTEQADIKLYKLDKLWFDGVAICLDIFRDCSLKILKAWNCTKVTMREIVDFVSRFQNTLEELYITATDDVLIELMKLDRLMLKKLMLNCFELVNDSLIIEFCRKQPLLEHLDFSHMDGIDQKKLKKIGKFCPRLKYFSVYIEPDTLLDLTFMSGMLRLNNLGINSINEDFTNYTGSILSHLDDVASPLCPNLKEVTISEKIFRDCCLQNILAKMPNLQTLTLKDSVLDWPDLQKALNSVKLLRNFTLFSVDVDTKKSAYCEFENLANLTRLEICACDLPQALLVTLLTRCPNLEELNLPSLLQYALDDETVRVIGQKLPSLNHLTVQRSKLSEAGERFIRENCGTLQVLKITKPHTHFWK